MIKTKTKTKNIFDWSRTKKKKEFYKNEEKKKKELSVENKIIMWRI